MKTDLSPYCIYTIRQSDVVADLLKKGGRGSLKENKKWATAQALLEQAKKEGTRLPVVFAAGECIRGLIYWAVITNVEVKPHGPYHATTTFSFSGLRRIASRPPLSSLTLRSTGKQLSDHFIRPYAICHTPQLLRAANR
jgi:hypothetical protein